MKALICGRCQTPVPIPEDAQEVTCPHCLLDWVPTRDGMGWQAHLIPADEGQEAETVMRCRCAHPDGVMCPSQGETFQRCPHCQTLFALLNDEWVIDPPLSRALAMYCLSFPNDEETLNKYLDYLSETSTQENPPQ